METRQTQIDVVIISYAKDDNLKRITMDGIESLIRSESGIQFNIFVIESNFLVNYDHYPHAFTIYPFLPSGLCHTFNYNAFLNLGAKRGKSPYVFLANNDLTYEKGWASEILRQMHFYPHIMSASPFCPETQDINDWNHLSIHEGYTIRRQFAGWAFMIKREALEKIGYIDEEVEFWYSDNLTLDQYKYYGIRHALITKSVVYHHDKNLGTTGMMALDDKEKSEFTVGQYEKYLEAKKKYVNKSFW